MLSGRKVPEDVKILEKSKKQMVGRGSFPKIEMGHEHVVLWQQAS